VKYLLDTNTISFAIRGVGRVGTRLQEANPEDVALSVVTEAELWFGVEKRGSARLRQSVEGFLSGVTILEYDRAAAREYGRVRALLEKRGRPIGIADTMIAAHALSQGMTLVTNNGKHFRRVRGLKSEDWL
jgi:tRNA(fMet)-specific endonuclease VapC